MESPNVKKRMQAINAQVMLKRTSSLWQPRLPSRGDLAQEISNTHEPATEIPWGAETKNVLIDW
jgi:hypothetical protein